ncbi:MAG TPA: KH domain-containing protein [Candidatus Dojkabacteria bacterium]|nr:KH domain-containing protein [Candidatus Dojkabacteria bacterium]HNW23345.1 KH domain-containing protein [Candidatus Dojkabacteria bacterium]
MKELLEHIIKSIVNYPDDVSVDERESVDFPGLTILTIDVNENDKGVIIGRKGRTINSIRDIITISAIRSNKRVRVILKDDKVAHESEQEEDMLGDEI